LYDKLPGKAIVEGTCLICDKKWSRKKWTLEKSLKKYGNAGYCSRKCSNKAKINWVIINCEECGKPSQKRHYDTLFNKHFFCSYSCHAKYKNRNKKNGSKRSTIEKHIEEQIKSHFPTINFTCNDTITLGGLELDFLFPDFKLAIELNGITHYEPIYGIDRLSRSQDSDKRKMISCYQLGIELAVIDVSGAKYLTQKWKDTYWKEVKNILEPIVVGSRKHN
jgi:very-short-patch-repair endonuclease